MNCLRAGLLAITLLGAHTLWPAAPVEAGQITLGFEEFALPPGSADNDFTGNLPPGFASGGAFFNNYRELVEFNGQFFESWWGWAVSTTTDVTTPGYDPATGQILNQFGAYNLPDGTGAGGSAHYLVGFTSTPNQAFIDLPSGYLPVSVDLTNTTYAALSMLNGDGFAKRFGGLLGTDPDFFRLTITGFASPGAAGAVLGAVEVFLADYRFTDSSQDYLLSSWTTFDLSSLAGSGSLGFSLDSSDNSDFGGVLLMNTPSYFALDNLRLLNPALVPEPASLVLLAAGSALLTCGAVCRQRRRA